MANENIPQSETTTAKTFVVPTPDPGESLTVILDAGEVPQINFDPGTESTQEFVDNDLVFTLDGGAVLTFQDFAADVNNGDVTAIMLADGAVIPIEAIMAAWNLEVPEVAAGPGAAGGGGSEYNDDMGDALDGINKLGVQDPDPFAGETPEALEDEQVVLPTPENNPPVVEDESVNVSEEGLRGGNPDEEGNQDTTNETSQTGQMVVSDPDGDPLTVTFTAPDAPLTSGGEPVVWDGDGTNTLVGYAGEQGPEVIRIEIDDDGNYTVTISGPVDHPDDSVEDDLSVDITVNVSDGTDTTSGTMTVTLEDDSPTVDVDIEVEPDVGSVTTQDADTIGEASDTDSGNFSAYFDVTSSFGADGAGTGPTVTYSLSVTTAVTGLSSNGDDITVAMDGDDIVGSTNDGAVDIFRVSVDSETGDVTLTQYEEIDHLPEDVDGVNDNAYEKLAEGNVILTASATMVDFDGDEVSDSEDVDISGFLGFDDDVPLAVNDGPATPDEDTAVDINVMSNDTAGADGVDWANSGDEDTVYVSSQPSKGSVEYNDDGTFTYTPTPGQEGSDSFKYTIVDGDGDSSEATVTINLAEDSTPTVSVTDGSVDEAALADGSDPDSPNETTSGSFTVTTGNDTGTLQVQDKDGDWVSIAASGDTAVDGKYGDLTVTGDGSGGYTWSYTLTDNTLDHTDTDPNDGDSDRGTADQVFDNFATRVNDSDGDSTADDGIDATETLTIAVNDDGPTAVNDYDNVVVDDEGEGSTSGNVYTNDTIGADGPNTPVVVAVDGDADNVGNVVQGIYGELTLNSDGSYTYEYTGDPSETPVVIDDLGDATFSAFDLTSPYAGDNLDLTAIPDADVQVNQGSKGGLGVKGDGGSGKIDDGEELVVQLDNPIRGEFMFEIGQYNAQQSDLDAMTWGVYDSDGTLVDSGNFAELGGTANNNGTYTADAITFDVPIGYIVFGYDSDNESGYTVTNIEYIDLDFETGVEDFTYTIQDADGDTSTAHLYITADEFVKGDASGNILEGGSGDDILQGYGGDDSLFGDSGNDILVGGEGEDTFNFNIGTTDDGEDTITDFSLADDVLGFHEVLDVDSVTINLDGDDVTLTTDSGTTVTLQGVNSGNAFDGYDGASLATFVDDNPAAINVETNPDTYGS